MGASVRTGAGGFPEDGLALLVVGLLDDVQQQQLVAGAQQVVRRPLQRGAAPLGEVHRQPHPPLAPSTGHLSLSLSRSLSQLHGSSCGGGLLEDGTGRGLGGGHGLGCEGGGVGGLCQRQFSTTGLMEAKGHLLPW